VTVSAQASMLTTESGAVNSNVTTDRMNSLPILGVGGATASTHGVRNPLASSVLSAGVFWVPNTSMRVNGAPTNTFGIKFDGQDITNGVNTSNSQAQMQPSVDALEEVAIQASNYSAEFGQAGSGLIQYTTKSGTNSFHGSAYDYLVNEALWAHQSLDHLRNKQRRNDYGGTIGGPILIPKIYSGRDRTFFFFNFEQFRESSVITNQVKTVPTLAYRGGDFSSLLTGKVFTGALATDGLGNTMKEGMIFDPTTERTASNGTRARLQYVGNQIPVASFDPSAVKIQNFIPKPNLGAPGQTTGNFVNAFPSDRVTPIPSVKIDHSFSARFKISGYWSSTSTEVAYAPGGFALSEGFPDEITQTRGTYIYSRTWRANLDYTVTSKRKLAALVEDGLVDGWDDPRMPTLAGVRRRGYPAAAIRNFWERAGVSKQVSTIEYSVLEACVREELDAAAPRRLGVIDPLKLVITNLPDGHAETLTFPNHPKNEVFGTRAVPFSGELWIEREDFLEEPVKGFHRLVPGGEVRLRGVGIVKCVDVKKDTSGKVSEVLCTLDATSRAGQEGAERKVKGTIHWVSARHAIEAEVRLYERLFTVADPDDDTDGKTYRDYINSNSRRVVRGFVESSLGDAQAGTALQFERLGYFVADSRDHAPGHPVFNRIVTLRDSFAKATK